MHISELEKNFVLQFVWWVVLILTFHLLNLLVVEHVNDGTFG